jgi:hypothetical protein
MRLVFEIMDRTNLQSLNFADIKNFVVRRRVGGV